MHPSIEQMLLSIGVTCDYKPEIMREEILDVMKGYEGLIIRNKTVVDKELLDHSPKLQFIARAGAGLDKMDLKEVEKRGVKILNAPEGNRDAVGEHVVGMMLALLNNFIKGHLEIRNGVWDREGNRGHELSAMTVGVIGYGNMGRSVAKKLSGFGCEVLAYDKYKKGFSDIYAREVILEELFENVDILTLHTPLTEETKYMCDINFWNRFKKSLWFINTARGPISAFGSIVEGLESGRLRGAGLDVLENEKIEALSGDQRDSFNKLINMDNVLLTPHVGGWSFESHKKINEVLVYKIKEYLKSFN